MLKDVIGGMDDKCMIVNYIYADVGALPDKGFIKSNIAILCDEDKQEYLNKIKIWQKEFQNEITRRSKLDRTWAYECQVLDEVWGDLWKDLDPNRRQDLESY